MTNHIEKVACEWAPYTEGPPTIIRLGPHAARLPWPREVQAEAIAQFSEGLKTGRTTLRGVRFATGEVEIIPLSDIRECDFKNGELRELGRRLPRFTDLEVDLAEIRRVFAEKPMIDEPDKSRAAKIPAIEQAIKTLGRKTLEKCPGKDRWQKIKDEAARCGTAVGFTLIGEVWRGEKGTSREVASPRLNVTKND